MAIRFFNDQDVFGDATIEGILQVGPVGSGLKVDNSSNDYNVGIGTASPSAKIHVAGKAIIQTSGTATAHSDTDLLVANSIAASSTSQIQILSGVSGSSNLYFSDTTAYSVGGIQYNHTDNKMTLRVAAGSKMTILSSGNVGIGTTTPDEKLDVENGNIRLKSNSDGNNGLFRLYDTAGVESGQLYPFAGDLRIYSPNDIIFNNSGKVGIGTSSPANKLTVRTSTINDGLYLETSQPVTYGKIYNTNSESFPVGNLHLAYGTNTTAIIQALSNRMSLRGGYTTGGQISFLSASTEIMRMTSTGLGIGTTSPYTKLSVVKDITTTAEFGSFGQFTIQGATNASKILSFGFNTATDVGFIQAMVNGTSYNDLLLNARGGNVGIGTTSPALQSGGTGLHINAPTSSEIKFTNSTTGTTASDGTALVSNGTGFTINNREAGSLALGTNNSTRLYIDSAGNVGIGTTSPSHKLEVIGDSNDTMRVYRPGNRTLLNIDADPGRTSALAIDIAGTTQYYVGMPTQAVSGLGARFAISYQGAPSFVLEGSTGNVGIGTASPGEKLEVVGNIILTNSDSRLRGGTLAGRLVVSNSDTTSYITLNGSTRAGGANDISFVANSTSAMRITSAGNVGIGTTSPQANLEVASLDTNNSAIIRLTSKDLSVVDEQDLSEIQFYNSDADGAHVSAYIKNIAAETYGRKGQLAFGTSQTNSTNAVEAMRINEAGNVGIGTTTPTQKLQIGSTSSGGATTSPDAITLGATYSSVAGSNLKIRVYDSAGSVAGFGVSGGQLDYSTWSTAADHVFYAGGSQLMRIKGNGNVGIGTTSPTSTLTLGNATDNVAELRVLRSNSASGTYASVNTVGGTSQFGSSGATRVYSTGNESLNLRTNGSDRLTILSGGNVGIGTTSPSSKLEVNGIVKIGNVTTGLSMNGNSATEFSISGADTGGNAWNSIHIKADGNDGLFIEKDTNNVGIGTTSPAAKLDVSGAGRFDGTLTATTFLGDLNGTINTTTTAVTKANATNDTTVATTAFVQNLIGTIPAGLVFQGTWNAATNTPTLTSGAGTTGHFYIVSTSGNTNLDGITDWVTGDWAVFIEQGGTDAWEKIDNSSVLDGAGTGQTVPLWDGSGTSNTLTDSPITISGNNSTFAGNVTVGGNSITVNPASGDAVLNLTHSSQSLRIDQNSLRTTTNSSFTFLTNSTTALTLDTSQNATFGNDISLGGNLTITSNARYLRAKDSAGTTTRLLGINGSNSTYIGPIDAYAGGGILYGVSANVSSHTLYTGASARLHINSSGNVGIGTTSPSEKLDVSGNIKSNHIYAETYRSSRADGDIYIQAASSNDFVSIGTEGGNNNVLRVQGNGNVGIGTTNPTRELEVQGVGNVYIKVAASTDDDSSAIELENTQNTWTIKNDDTADDALKFQSAGGTKVTILKTGNVGIGTTSPQQKLDVVGRVRASYDTSNYYEIGASSAGGFVVGKSGGVETVNIRTYGDSHFNGGNVGIGTTNPTSKFTVTNGDVEIQSNGSSSMTNYLKIATHTNGSWGSFIAADSYYNSTLNTNLTLGVSNAGSALNVLHITSGGNVGIGTTSPGEKLEVNGNIRLGNSPSLLWGSNNLTLKTASSSTIGVFSLAPNSDGTVYAPRFQMLNASGVVGVSIRTDANSYFNGGNVGIGTTSPGEKFAVKGDASYIEITHPTATSFSGIKFSEGGTPQGSIQNIGTSFATVARRGNFEIFHNASGNLTLQHSGGNVGIGTTSPGDKLDVNGNTKVRGRLQVGAYTSADSSIISQSGDIQLRVGSTSITNNPFIRLQGNSGTGAVYADIKLDTVNQLLIFNDPGTTGGSTGTNPMVLDATGNVGIGTTSPGAKLQLGDYPSNNIDITTYPNVPSEHMLHLIAPETTNRYGGGISFGENTFTAANITVQDAGSNGSLHMLFGTRHTSGIVQERMRIASNGNVGIGTTSPISKLEISGPTGSYLSGIGFSATGTGARTYRTYIGTNGYFYFDDATGGSSRLTIDTSGNVGIGTTNPYSKLHIDSNSNSAYTNGFRNGELRVANDNSSNIANQTSNIVLSATGWAGVTTGVAQLSVIQDGSNVSNGTFTIKVRDNGTHYEAFRIKHNGNVGIGTTSPQSKLQVDGGVQMADDTDAASASKVGTLRYRTSGNNSYVDMCMQTGASTYEWVNIVQNNW